MSCNTYFQNTEQEFEVSNNRNGYGLPSGIHFAHRNIPASLAHRAIETSTPLRIERSFTAEDFVQPVHYFFSTAQPKRHGSFDPRIALLHRAQDQSRTYSNSIPEFIVPAVGFDGEVDCLVTWQMRAERLHFSFDISPDDLRQSLDASREAPSSFGHSVAFDAHGFALIIDWLAFRKNAEAPSMQSAVLRQLREISYDPAHDSFWTGFGGYSKHDKVPSAEEVKGVREAIARTMMTGRLSF